MHPSCSIISGGKTRDAKARRKIALNWVSRPPMPILEKSQSGLMMLCLWTLPLLLPVRKIGEPSPFSKVMAVLGKLRPMEALTGLPPAPPPSMAERSQVWTSVIVTCKQLLVRSFGSFGACLQWVKRVCLSVSSCIKLHASGYKDNTLDMTDAHREKRLVPELEDHGLPDGESLLVELH